jgi:putative transcriptional regulator
LQEELKERSWLTVKANRKIVFEPEEATIWKEALRLLGGDYEQLVNYPIDPQLN